MSLKIEELCPLQGDGTDKSDCAGQGREGRGRERRRTRRDSSFTSRESCLPGRRATRWWRARVPMVGVTQDFIPSTERWYHEYAIGLRSNNAHRHTQRHPTTSSVPGCRRRASERFNSGSRIRSSLSQPARQPTAADRSRVGIR